jgi:hypothetical protein
MSPSDVNMFSEEYMQLERMCEFVSEEDFVERDVDTDGKPLPKVLLYRAHTN